MDEHLKRRHRGTSTKRITKKKHLHQPLYPSRPTSKCCFAAFKPLALKSAPESASSASFSLSLCHASSIYIVYNKLSKPLYHELHLHISYTYMISSFRLRFASSFNEKRPHLITTSKPLSRSPISSFRELFIKLCHAQSTSTTSSANLYIMSFLHSTSYIPLPTTLRPYWKTTSPHFFKICMRFPSSPPQLPRSHRATKQSKQKKLKREYKLKQ